MTEEDEAFEDLAKRQGDWGMQGSRKHQIMRYVEPSQRPWVGLTLTQVKLLGEGVQEEAIKSGHSRDWVFYTHINEALKEKNT